jgi:hypothetical protein
MHENSERTIQISKFRILNLQILIPIQNSEIQFHMKSLKSGRERETKWQIKRNSRTLKVVIKLLVRANFMMDSRIVNE